MKAVVYAGPGRVTVDDVSEPRLEEPDDALVRVTLSAICDARAPITHRDSVFKSPVRSD